MPTSPSLRRALRALPFGLFSLLAVASGCGAGVGSAQTPSLDKPVAAQLVRDDGVPAAVPVPGARTAVIEFWSPTCEPCKRTIPALLARRAEIEQKGATILLIAVIDKDSSADEARAVLSLWGIDERFAVDPGGVYLAKIGAGDVPAFAIVDSAGVLRWVAPPGVTMSNVLAAIP